MNVLFVTLGNLKDMSQQGIYVDLLKEFCENGHNVYAITPMERKYGKKSMFVEDNGITILHAKTGNITQCSFIEKGISTLLIENNFKRAIKKYYSSVKFDLVVYSTPPITFCNVIKYVKNRDNAKTYLLLKDIFPQNAVDLGTFSKNSPIHWFFRSKEKAIYKVSDYIGCMSPANVEYILRNNDVDKEKVGVAVNGFKPRIENISDEEKIKIRQKYNLPLDKSIYIYGGNLGKPQGIPFMLECLKSRRHAEELYLIVGSGTEFKRIEAAIEEEKLENVRVMSKLPKAEYEKLVKSCNVGLIFLDKRFTIPNYPSRVLSYLQAGMPVLACTDKNSDIGTWLEENAVGVWCASDSVEGYGNAIYKMEELVKDENIQERTQKLLLDNFTSRHTYEAIITNI